MLGFHVKLTENGATMPVPSSGMVVGEPTASLLMVTLPLTYPAPAGAKTIFKFAADVNSDQTVEIERMQHMLDAP